MKRIISHFVLLLFIFTLIPLNTTVIYASQPGLTVNKTVFSVGEDIVVSFSDLDPTAYGTLPIELRLYKEGETPGVHASTDYVVVHSSTVDLGSSGTITLPRDGARTHMTSYAAGKYKIMLLYGNQSICDPVSITITGDVALTTDKTKYELGENIVISYANVAASLAGSNDIEIRLYKENDVPGTHASTDYATLYKQSSGINKTPGGTLVFPADGERPISSYEPGRYKVMLLRANTSLCDPVYISIDEPVLTLNKSVYTVGEPIIVNYKNAYASYDKGQGVDIRIYKVGDTPGVNPSQDYYVLHNKTTGISRPEAGTIEFPKDGARNKTQYDPGNYVIMVLYANTPICDPLPFKIDDNIVFKTDKTEYEAGEAIKVTYGNVKKSYDTGLGLEIRLYKQGVVPGVNASQDYVILHNTSKGIDLLTYGEVSFPEDGARSKSEYVGGTYVVMLLHGNTPICDPITIRINAPQPRVTVSKSVYVVGEVIKVNYQDISKAHDEGLGLEIRIYKKGDVPGVNTSQEYVILYNASKGIDLLKSGTLSFPGDGAREKTEFEEGVYVVMLIHGNTPICEVSFSVMKNPQTGDDGVLVALIMLTSMTILLVSKGKLRVKR